MERSSSCPNVESGSKRHSVGSNFSKSSNYKEQIKRNKRRHMKLEATQYRLEQLQQEQHEQKMCELYAPVYKCDVRNMKRQSKHAAKLLEQQMQMWCVISIIL